MRFVGAEFDSCQGISVSLNNITAELGPLPESHENARLQRESFKALDRLLSWQNIFVFRYEPVEDYGVDGSLELNIDNRMTNFRAQVQRRLPRI
jgi:hypothetical protein